MLKQILCSSLYIISIILRQDLSTAGEHLQSEHNMQGKAGLYTSVHWHVLEDVSARSYSLPLKQSLERLLLSMVMLRPRRHLFG